MTLSLPPPTPHHLPLPEQEYNDQFAQFQEKITSTKNSQVTPTEISPEVINTLCLILSVSQELKTTIWRGLSLLLSNYEYIESSKGKASKLASKKDNESVKRDEESKKKSLEWAIVGSILYIMRFHNMSGVTVTAADMTSKQQYHSIFSQKEQTYFVVKFCEFAKGRTSAKELTDVLTKIEKLINNELLLPDIPIRLKDWIKHIRSIITSNTSEARKNENVDSKRAFHGLTRMIGPNLIYMTAQSLKDYESWESTILERLSELEAHKKRKIER